MEVEEHYCSAEGGQGASQLSARCGCGVGGARCQVWGGNGEGGQRCSQLSARWAVVWVVPGVRGGEAATK